MSDATKEMHLAYAIWTLCAVVMLVYLLPTIIAFCKRHPQKWMVFLLNLCAGWTGIAWFAALIWAFAPNWSEDMSKDDLRYVREQNGIPHSFEEPTDMHPLVSDFARIRRLYDSGALTPHEFETLRQATIDAEMARQGR